jgi:hypothetical protein
MDWKTVWHTGIAPELTLPGLKALRRALQENSKKLLQGRSYKTSITRHGIFGTCPICYCDWQGSKDSELHTPKSLDEFFLRVWLRSGIRAGQPEACDIFIDWWDLTEREEAVSALLDEVQKTITEREAKGEFDGSQERNSGSRGGA